MIAILAVACLMVAGSTQKTCAQPTTETVKTGASVSTDAATSPYGVSATSTSSGGTSETELRIVHDQMVRLLTRGGKTSTQENKKASLRVVANGTAVGAPTSITIEAPVNGSVKIEVVNIASGVIIMQTSASVHRGSNTIQLALVELGSGEYMIRVTQGQVNATTAFNVAR